MTGLHASAAMSTARAPDIAILAHLEPGEGAARGTADGAGVARVLTRLANGFAARGRRVDFVLLQAGTSPGGLDPRVRMVDLGSARIRRALGPLARYLRETRPRAVLSAKEHANILAVTARRLSGQRASRLLLSTHNPLGPRLAEMWGPRERLLLPPLIRWAYPQADGVIGVSDGIAEELRGLLPGAAARIHRIWNPIVDGMPGAVPPATPSDGPLDAARIAGHFADAEGPLIVAAARLLPHKGLATVIDAVAHIAVGRPVRLAILGEGPERARLEAAIGHHGLGGRIALPGWQADLTPWLAAADAFAHGAAFEGFGNVLVEALAQGCPVVATDCPVGPGEILGRGAYGRLVPVGDAGAMAVALTDTLDAPPDRARLIARAAEFSSRASVDAYLAQLEG